MSLEQKYNLVFAGAIKEGFNLLDVQKVFIGKFNLSVEKVPIYFSGKRVVLKKGLSKGKADLLKSKFLSVGAETIVVPYIGDLDTMKAKNKNAQFNQSQSKQNQTNLSQEAPTKEKSVVERIAAQSEVTTEMKDSIDSIEENTSDDKEMQRKIALAQSMILEEQIKSQIESKNQSPSYKKLTYLSIFLVFAGFLLYFYSKGGV